jgi:hypothetical protein
MPASIRGHQGLFKVFENGSEVVIDTITNVSVNQDSNFMRSMYVGNPLPEGDQSIEGWSGSIDMEVKNDVVDQFIDGLVTNNLNGIGVSDYTFITTENYPDGSSASYVYFDCQWSMSKSQSGLSDKMTKTLNFQASGRVRL